MLVETLNNIISITLSESDGLLLGHYTAPDERVKIQTKANQILSWSKTGSKIIYNGGARKILSFSNGVVFNNDEYGNIYYLEKEKTSLLIEGSLNLTSPSPRSSKDYFYFTDDKDEQNSLSLKYQNDGRINEVKIKSLGIENFGQFFGYRGSLISLFDLASSDKIWEVDLQSKLPLSRIKIKTCLLLKDYTLILLRGGMLLRVSNADGSIEWMCEDIYDFKMYGESLFVTSKSEFLKIDSISGTELMSQRYSEIGFISPPTLPIYCSGELMILGQIVPGHLTILKMGSLELIDQISIPEPLNNIRNSEESVIVFENHVFVQVLPHTVHVFSIEDKLSRDE